MLSKMKTLKNWFRGKSEGPKQVKQTNMSNNIYAQSSLEGIETNGYTFFEKNDNFLNISLARELDIAQFGLTNDSGVVNFEALTLINAITGMAKLDVSGAQMCLERLRKKAMLRNKTVSNEDLLEIITRFEFFMFNVSLLYDNLMYNMYTLCRPPDEAGSLFRTIEQKLANGESQNFTLKGKQAINNSLLSEKLRIEIKLQATKTSGEYSFKGNGVIRKEQELCTTTMSVKESSIKSSSEKADTEKSEMETEVTECDGSNDSTEVTEATEPNEDDGTSESDDTDRPVLHVMPTIAEVASSQMTSQNKINKTTSPTINQQSESSITPLEKTSEEEVGDKKSSASSSSGDSDESSSNKSKKDAELNEEPQKLENEKQQRSSKTNNDKQRTSIINNTAKQHSSRDKVPSKAASNSKNTSKTSTNEKQGSSNETSSDKVSSKDASNSKNTSKTSTDEKQRSSNEKTSDKVSSKDASNTGSKNTSKTSTDGKQVSSNKTSNKEKTSTASSENSSSSSSDGSSSTSDDSSERSTKSENRKKKAGSKSENNSSGNMIENDLKRMQLSPNQNNRNMHHMKDYQENLARRIKRLPTRLIYGSDERNEKKRTLHCIFRLTSNHSEKRYYSKNQKYIRKSNHKEQI